MKNISKPFFSILLIAIITLFLTPLTTSAQKLKGGTPKAQPQDKKSSIMMSQIAPSYAQHVVSFYKLKSYSVSRDDSTNILIMDGIKEDQPISALIAFDPTTITPEEKESLAFCERAALLALSMGSGYEFAMLMFGSKLGSNQYSTLLSQQSAYVRCELKKK